MHVLGTCLNIFTVLAFLHLAVLRLKPQLAPKRRVAGLQVAEHLPRGALWYLPDEVARHKLASGLRALPPAARHLGAVTLHVFAFTLGLKDGLDARCGDRGLLLQRLLRDGLLCSMERVLGLWLILVRVE